MIQLDDAAMVRWGYSALPAWLRRQMLTKFYASLEYAVGMRLAALLDDDQLEEFELIVEANDSERGHAYLLEHLPAYPEVVRATFRDLEELMCHAAPTILAVFGVRDTKPGRPHNSDARLEVSSHPDDLDGLGGLDEYAHEDEFGPDTETLFDPNLELRDDVDDSDDVPEIGDVAGACGGELDVGSDPSDRGDVPVAPSPRRTASGGLR
jgi:hypothetical protein